MKHLLKRESWTTALSLTDQRAKGSPPEKNTTDEKELLTLAPGYSSRWQKSKSMKIMSANHSS
jgi:hypothetical protein